MVVHKGKYATADLLFLRFSCLNESRDIEVREKEIYPLKYKQINKYLILLSETYSVILQAHIIFFFILPKFIYPYL